jgi:hypothetical protein
LAKQPLNTPNNKQADGLGKLNFYVSLSSRGSESQDLWGTVSRLAVIAITVNINTNQIAKADGIEAAGSAATRNDSWITRLATRQNNSTMHRLVGSQ